MKNYIKSIIAIVALVAIVVALMLWGFDYLTYSSFIFTWIFFLFSISAIFVAIEDDF